MKETLDSVPTSEFAEKENFGNRKLIRPTLQRENSGNHVAPPTPVQERRERPDRQDRHDRGDRPMGGGGGKRPAPPEQTNAENFYYQKQMQSRTSMVIVLQDGEEIHGVIEWYDRNCLKINRSGAANLMVYKPSIKYMYKEGENAKR